MAKKKQPATLDEIRDLMYKAESRAKLPWLFSIGTSILAIGLALLVKSGAEIWTPGAYIAIAIGVLIMVISALISLVEKGE